MIIIALIAVFGLLSSFPHLRHTCLTLCALNIFLLFLNTVCDANGNTLYLLEAIGTTLAAVSLCYGRSFYQATILLATLCAYGALAYDISQGRHVLIYNNYETVIYGLIACQFVGIFTALQYINHDHIKRVVRNCFYLPWSKRA